MATADSNGGCCCKKSAESSRCRCSCHPLVPGAFAVLLWVLIGTVGYWLLGNSSEVPEHDGNGGVVMVEYRSWTIAQSFYYSVQAGLSIGFGLLSETSDRSRLFTVFYILSGSSFIVGALVYFIQLSLSKQESFQSEEERKLARFSTGIKADGYGGFNLRQLHELMICYPEHMADLCMRLESDYCTAQAKIKEFGESSLRERAAMVDSLLKEACSSLEEFENEALSIPDLLKLHMQEASWRQRLYHFLRSHATMARQLLATICWVSMGAIYICVTEDTSFISGLYFAVTSLSTAGLYSVTSTASGSVYWFTGIYCLVGVPLYGIMLGSYANLLVEQYNKEQLLQSIHERMGGASIAFLEHMVREEHKDEADFADYVEIQLLRLGKVDRDFLRQLREDFSRLDEEGHGLIPIDKFITQNQRKAVEHEKAAGATRNISSATLAETGDDFPMEASIEVEV